MNNHAIYRKNVYNHFLTTRLFSKYFYIVYNTKKMVLHFQGYYVTFSNEKQTSPPKVCLLKTKLPSWIWCDKWPKLKLWILHVIPSQLFLPNSTLNKSKSDLADFLYCYIEFCYLHQNQRGDFDFKNHRLNLSETKNQIRRFGFN